MKKRIVFIALASACLALLPHTTRAHVLVTDTTGTTGLILHVNPNDEPAAGQTSNLLFDIQDDELADKSTAATLSVAGAGGAVDVPLSANDGLFSADYTFPAGGMYDLTLTVSGGEKSYVFHTAQHVAGGMASPLDAPSRPFASAVLAISGGLLLVMLVVIFNRKKEILAQSRF